MIQAVYGRKATFALELVASRVDLQGNTIEYEYCPSQTDIILVTLKGKDYLQNMDVIKRDNVLHLVWTPLRMGLHFIDVRIITYEGVRMYANLREPVEVIRYHQIPEGKEVERNLAFKLNLKRY